MTLAELVHEGSVESDYKITFFLFSTPIFPWFLGPISQRDLKTDLDLNLRLWS